MLTNFSSNTASQLESELGQSTLTQNHSKSSVRLHVFLAKAGLGSRRAMETAIADGRAEVNGSVVTKMGSKIHPDSDIVVFDGATIRSSNVIKVYVLLYKPRGVLSTTKDDYGRKTVMDCLPKELLRHRLFPVGRLDWNSEGLVLLTNDGDLAHRLLHPKFEHSRHYLVKVTGRPKESQLNKLRHGLQLEDGFTSPTKIKEIGFHDSYTELEMTMREGRNRQIRRMFSSIGSSVTHLRRTGLATLNIGKLGPSESRLLTSAEVSKLRKSAGLE